MAVVGYATVQLIPSLKGFGTSVNGQMRPVVQNVGSRAGKEAGGLFGGGFVSTVGKIMTAAGIYEIGSRVAGGISDAITTGIKGFADLQTYTISFKTLLGSASKANDMIRSLYDFAAKTPFDVEGSVVGAQKLLGVGVAAKDVVPTLTTLGDATAALGGSTADFNSVLLAYSQIMARGKVSTQDLYQISNTGIPIFQLLSQALGKPVGEIQKLIETGKLASDDVLPQLLMVMNQDYGGAMAGQAQTLTGLWSTFKDTMSQVLTQALTPVGEWLSNILPSATTAATNAIQWISDKLNLVSNWVALHRDEIATAFQPFAAALASTDWEGLLGTIATNLGQVAENSLPVATSLGQIANDILPPMVDLFNDLNTAMGGFVKQAPAVNEGAQGVNEGFQGFASPPTGFIDFINGTLNPLSRLSGLLQDVSTYISPVVSGMIQIVDAFAKGQSAASVFADALSGKFGGAMQVVATGANVMALGFASAFSRMGLAVVTFITKATQGFVRFSAQLIENVTSGISKAVDVVRSSGTLFYTAAVAAVARLIAGVAAKIGDAKTTVSNGVGAAVGVVTSYGSLFFSAGAALVSGLVKGIRSKIHEIKDAVGAAMSAAANFLPHSPAPEGPFSGKGWTLYSGRALVDGFSKGIQQRRPALRSLMNDTLSATNLGGAPALSVAGSVAAASTTGGKYIGAVNLNTTNTNAGVVNDLNFYLRNLDRGGR